MSDEEKKNVLWNDPQMAKDYVPNMDAKKAWTGSTARIQQLFLINFFKDVT